MEKKVIFYRSRNVRKPERGTSQAAGIDLFIPYCDEKFISDFKTKNPDIEYVCIKNSEEPTGQKMSITIKPHERVMIPSGVHTYMMPKESALIAANKSGVSTKKGLVFTCQVIDSDYTGELHIGVVNTSNKDVILNSGEKLIQFIHTPVYFSKLDECDNFETFLDMHKDTERGDGAFGSTDIKK